MPLANMKTIGILGGMSWESTATYYRLLNEGVREACGKLHSAPIVLRSVDFQPLQQYQHEGRWQEISTTLSRAAQQIEAAEAECLLLATNTMHKVADDLSAAVNIPLLHIADAVGEECHAGALDKIGLLATAFTMEDNFYQKHLQEQYGITVAVPPAAQRQRLHEIIYQELCQGEKKATSKQYLLQCIDDLAAAGAQAVLLGCTEIGLLIEQQDSPLLLLDSTVLHVEQALRWSLGGDAHRVRMN